MLGFHFQRRMQKICRLRWCVLIVSVLASLARPDLLRAQDRQKQVLVLYSTGRDTRVSIVGERELPRILKHGLGKAASTITPNISTRGGSQTLVTGPPQ